MFGCNITPNSNKKQESPVPESAEIKELPVELIEKALKPEKKLYLNGIYEYEYPYNTEGMNENQYIAFKKEGDSVEAWYFGTSDEFDESREGYLPGYFVSKIENFTTKDDSIFFSISTANNQCYSTRPPIGLVDSKNLDEQYKEWNYNDRIQTINYSGNLDGLNIFINMFGETRTYRKTRNYFHLEIDNYDPMKCRTEPLLEVHQNLENLSEKMVYDFLSTFSMICEANVEFGEWSNELLFKALSSNPELVLNVLSKNLNQLDTVSIFAELESPLHDLIPIDSIASQIELLNLDKNIKNTVLKKLKSLK